MSRLQKKCVIVSSGMHLLLAAIILVGPAFSSTKTPDVAEINFIPTIVTEAGPPGGGNPNARPPAPVVTPAPAPPNPAHQPPPPKLETKPPPETKPEVADPNDFSERKPKKPQISITPVVRPKATLRKSDSSNDDTARERQIANQRRKAGEQILGAARNIREGTSSATAIDENFGPGGGGPTYASYASLVQSIYQNAWIAPDDATSDTALTKARVTIASDGTVISSEIISRSGDSQMDASVQRALDRVPSIGRPFPEGMKDKQRSYILKFDLKVKRGLA